MVTEKFKTMSKIKSVLNDLQLIYDFHKSIEGY